jgi:cation transport regulator ChaB
MSYETITDVPAEEVEPYSDEQKEAFRASYNSALERVRR